MSIVLLAFVSAALSVSQLSSVNAQLASGEGMSDRVIDRHNFGYMLKHIYDIHVSTFDTKLVFHLNRHEWQVVFRSDDSNCGTEYNWTVPCLQMCIVLNAVTDVQCWPTV